MRRYSGRPFNQIKVLQMQARARTCFADVRRPDGAEVSGKRVVTVAPAQLVVELVKDVRRAMSGT